MSDEIEVILTPNVTEVVVPEGNVLLAESIGQLSDVNITSLQDTQFLRYNTSTQLWTNENVTFTSTVSGLSDTTISNPQNNQILKYDSTSSKWVNSNSANNRIQITHTTASLNTNQTEEFSISGFGKSYALHSIYISGGAWLRIYSDTASRNADALRTQQDDPAEGSGVVSEVVSSQASTFNITPSVLGHITSPETSIPLKITNISPSPQTYTISITALQLEA